MSHITEDSSTADEDGIRAYRPSDLKQVQLLVGAGVMEQLAETNKLAYFHPLTIAVWVALSTAFIQVAGWWPKPGYVLTYFSPVFAFFVVAVPIMLAFEWKHRQHFEPLLRTTLGLTDLSSIQDFYALSPASCFYVYQHKDAIIACVAIDAANPGEELESYLSGGESNKKTGVTEQMGGTSTGSATGRDTAAELKKRTTAAGSKASSTTTQARIRHFHTDLLYRTRSPIGPDLLAHALKHTFSASAKVDEIYAVDTPTKSANGRALKEAGFVGTGKVGPGGVESQGKFGAFGLREGWVKLSRGTWETKRS